jgi:AhpC/TSA family
VENTCAFSGVRPIGLPGAKAVVLYVYPYVAFLALLQAPVPRAGVPLIDDCSDYATVLATLAPSAPVEVRSAVAGNAKTCYAVTAQVEGKPVRGYVQGNDLIAVADFERQRAAVAASMVTAAPAETAPTAAAAVAPKVEKPHYPPFANFSALDMKGKAVSVRGMKGKVNLVCFWAAGNKSSIQELVAVSHLYGQFLKQGVDVLAVNLSGDSPQFRDTVDDFHSGFRIIPNGRDIAARYNIDYEDLPRTYVLNENFEVVASGLHGKALEDLVKKMVAER